MSSIIKPSELPKMREIAFEKFKARFADLWNRSAKEFIVDKINRVILCNESSGTCKALPFSIVFYMKKIDGEWYDSLFKSYVESEYIEPLFEGWDLQKSYSGTGPVATIEISEGEDSVRAFTFVIVISKPAVEGLTPQ